MRRLPPSREVVEYLDHGLMRPASIPPAPAPSVQGRCGAPPAAAPAPAPGPAPAAGAMVSVSPGTPNSSNRLGRAVAGAALAVFVMLGVLLGWVAAALAQPISPSPPDAGPSCVWDPSWASCRSWPLAAPVASEEGATETQCEDGLPRGAALRAEQHVAVGPFRPFRPAVAQRPNVAVRALPWVLLFALAFAFVLQRRDREPPEANSAVEDADRRPGCDVAVGSRQGARSYQEDAGAVLELPSASVIVVADGMGGHAGGARASKLVVEVVSDILRRHLPLLSEPAPEIVSGLLRNALAAAAAALRTEAEETGLTRLGVDGLRTTALVLVATAEHYVAAGIGDGVVFVRREDGELVRLFEAEKEVAQHLVASSLGPDVQGEPVFAELDREPGDLGIVATDGIADRVTLAFYDGLAAGLEEGSSVAQMVEEALEVVDADPAVFDDNATLGLCAESCSE